MPHGGIRRALMMAAILPLAGCGSLPAGAQLAIAGLSYLASVNNLGSQTLRFIDDRDTKACPLPAEVPHDKAETGPVAGQGL
jgi:hypothetical protein